MSVTGIWKPMAFDDEIVSSSWHVPGRANADSLYNIVDNYVDLGSHYYYGYGFCAGMRFRNVYIPKGAIIESAYLHLFISDAPEQTGTPCNAVLYGEAADNPTPFISYDLEGFKARPSTAAKVAWNNIEPWIILNEKRTSPDIKTIIQELTSRDGWAPGNNIILFQDSVILNARMRQGWSSDYSEQYAPQLEVTYALPDLPPEYQLTLASDKPAYWEDEDIFLSGILNFGSPVAGALVTLYRNGIPSLATTTLADGSYGFVDESPLKYVTPLSVAKLEPGVYQIKMPIQTPIGGNIYTFSMWDDGDTNPVKNVNIQEGGLPINLHATFTTTMRLAAAELGLIEYYTEYTPPEEPPGIWDRCEALVAPERVWVYAPDAASLSIDLSVKSPLGTGSIRADIPATVGVWDLYIGERFNADANLLYDFRVERPYSVFVQSPYATEWRIEVVSREDGGWNAHEVARQNVPANTMTEIILDYSGLTDLELQNIAQVSVIAFVNQLAFTGYVAGITMAAWTPIEVWDRCEALVAPERYWVRAPEVVSLSIDTSVKSPLGTGSIRADIPATVGVWDIYVAEIFNPDANILKDFTIERPYSVFVQSPQAVEWRIEVVSREDGGWNAHEVARQNVPANTMTEIILDYSGLTDLELQNIAQVSVIAFVNQLAFTGYVAGITMAAWTPIEVWDRCEALSEFERVWSKSPVEVTLSIDTSVKSPLGTGSIRADIPATVGVWDIYVVERFNPDANLLKDFTIERPYSVFVQSPYATEWRIEVVSREDGGWNPHEVARQNVPANTMTEILLDYSGIPEAALKMIAQVSVIAFVNQLAFTGYVAGITMAPIGASITKIIGELILRSPHLIIRRS